MSKKVTIDRLDLDVVVEVATCMLAVKARALHDRLCFNKVMRKRAVDDACATLALDIPLASDMRLDDVSGPYRVDTVDPTNARFSFRVSFRA